MHPPRYHRRFGYDLNLLPNKHLRKLEKGVGDIESAQERTGMTIGYPGWGMLYYLLLCHLEPGKRNVIVETGTNVGCSTIILAQALHDSGCDGLVYSIEVMEKEHSIARRNLEASGVGERVRLIRGDARAELPGVLVREPTIRFAFLDGSHLQNDVLAEFELLLPRLETDALVAFDNTYRIAEGSEDPRVNGALQVIRERHGGNLINLEFVSWYTPGLAIWQRTPRL